MVRQPPHQPTPMIALLQPKDLFPHQMMPVVQGVPGRIGHALSRVAKLAGGATVPRQGVVSVAVVVAVPDLGHHNTIKGQHPLAQQKHIHPTPPGHQSDVGVMTMPTPYPFGPTPHSFLSTPMFLLLLQCSYFLLRHFYFLLRCSYSYSDV